MKNNFHSTPRVWVATFVAVIFFRVLLFAQTNSESTNAPLKLLPPYGELPPTFWEQNAPLILFAGLAVVALAAFVLWLVFRPKPKIFIPPEMLTREALQKLRSQPEDGAGLSRVSQVVRNYFIAAFQLTAGELTTTEFNHELSRCKKINPELSAATAEFLRDCDARKFSTTGGSAKLGAATRALNLVEQAEQRRAQLRQLAQAKNQDPRA
jgi:hypothetical protein